MTTFWNVSLRHIFCLSITLAVVSVTVVARCVAQPPWTVVVLYPSGDGFSEAVCVREQQGGYAKISGSYHAILWDGSSQKWIDLAPPGSQHSNVSGMDAGFQAGAVQTGPGVTYAAMWRGSATSVVSLHPQGALSSYCTDVHGSVQVGTTLLPGNLYHASLWMGTPESWVDLNPIDSPGSDATGVHDGVQVGYAYFEVPNYGSFLHAGLWKGTAESWVDLHPPKYKVMESYARGVHNGQQVGSFYNVGTHQACMWEGAAESFKFIHPAGYSSSGAWGVYNGIQVGGVYKPSTARACLWRGTAESMELLPWPSTGFWLGCGAYAIYQDDKKTSIVGWGQDYFTNEVKALLWTRLNAAPCKPDCDASGELNIDDFICFQTTYAIGDMAADCDGDGQLLIDDFICFQTAYAIGC